MRRSLDDWRSLLSGDVPQLRQGFQRLLAGPILFTPFEEHDRRGVRFEGRIGLDAVLGGALVIEMASPAGFEPAFWP